MFLREAYYLTDFDVAQFWLTWHIFVPPWHIFVPPAPLKHQSTTEINRCLMGRKKEHKKKGGNLSGKSLGMYFLISVCTNSVFVRQWMEPWRSTRIKSMWLKNVSLLFVKHQSLKKINTCLIGRKREHEEPSRKKSFGKMCHSCWIFKLSSAKFFPTHLAYFCCQSGIRATFNLHVLQWFYSVKRRMQVSAGNIVDHKCIVPLHGCVEWYMHVHSHTHLSRFKHSQY